MPSTCEKAFYRVVGVISQLRSLTLNCRPQEPLNVKTCEEKDKLQARLKTALENWYSVKDVPDKDRETKAAQKKAHHI